MTKTVERQHVGTWIEPELVRELEERAEQADRSRSAELRIAIRRYLERTHDHNTERIVIGAETERPGRKFPETPGGAITEQSIG